MAECRARSLHCQKHQVTPALRSSPAEPATACSPSSICYSSDATAANISNEIYESNSLPQRSRGLSAVMLT